MANWIEYRLGRVKQYYEMYCKLANKTEGVCALPVIESKLEALLNLDAADGFKDSRDLHERVSSWIRKTQRTLREKLKEELERYSEKRFKIHGKY